MANPVLPVLLLIAIAPAASLETGGVDRVEMAQLSIHQRIVIRIPRMLGARAPERSQPDRPVRWTEKKGPKCVAAEALEGAIIAEAASVDLIVEDGTRLRAELDDHCPALDFYSGLYLKRTADGMVCAERDSIRARSGGTCRIDRFKRLVAKR